MAIPWYENEASYKAVLAMLPAAERQDPFTYDTFKANVERQQEQLKRSGFIAVRVPIDAAAVKGWCQANNLPVCRAAIGEFITVSLALSLRHGTNNN